VVNGQHADGGVEVLDELNEHLHVGDEHFLEHLRGKRI
jgi:hypothetical protein